MIVKQIDENLLKKSEGSKITGILIKWNGYKNKGVGIVMAIDLNLIEGLTGIKGSFKNPAPVKLKSINKLLSRLDDSFHAFKVEKEFVVTNDMKKQIMMAGTNPYALIGMMR